jgi:hypothetical protein
MKKIRGYTCLHFVVSNYNLRVNLSLALLEQDGEALLYIPYWSLEHKGEPWCIFPVGAGVRALLSFLLEQKRETYCILPVGAE